MTADRVDVLVITALLGELEALCSVEHGDGDWIEARDPSGLPYHHRRLGSLRIAAAWAGDMGETAAATRATALILHLDPACLAMCGICAGNRDDVFLGDVIVADRVYSYDHGKLVASEGPGGRREDIFHDITTYNLDHAWRAEAGHFANDSAFSAEMTRARPPSRGSQEAWLRHRLYHHARGAGLAPVEDPARRERCPDWTRRIEALTRARLVARVGNKLSLTAKGERLVEAEQLDYPDNHDGPEDPPFRVHVGPIATGKTVRKDPEIFSRLARLLRKTIGIEMEAAAIGSVAEALHRKAIIVKAVSDYGDQDKDDGYHAFASQASARILLRLLSSLPVTASLHTTEAPRAAVQHRERAAPAENPFHPVGSLPPDHPTYVVRPCDDELATALRKRPLIAVEGSFSSGKSSLALRARCALEGTHAACYVDLQDLRSDDEHIFFRDFFELLSRQLEREVDNWPLLDDPEGPPPALIIDELGCLSPRVANSFVPSLVKLADSHRDRVRVIVCLPVNKEGDSIESFLRSRGVENSKYGRSWARIKVPLLDAAGVEQLIALLPARSGAIARGAAAVLMRLSGGNPKAVQCALSALFDADAAGAPPADLQALLGERGIVRVKAEIPYRAAGTFAGPSYVEREADQLLLNAVQKNQRYPYIVAPRQSGKSSLLLRVRGELDPGSYTSAYVDLSTFDISDYEGFWRSLLEAIAEASDLDTSVINPRRPEVTFLAWLDRSPTRIVVFIDEIDTLIGAAFCDQFFSKLRSLFNKRAEAPKLARLLLVLAGAAHPTQLIKDNMRSPFNVGIEIKLDDLTPAHVRALASHLAASGAEVEGGVADRLHAATGGSVYLAQLILEKLWTESEDRRVIAASDMEAAIAAIVADADSEIHFRNIYQIVANNPPLLAAFEELRAGRSIDDVRSVQDLQLAGISDGVKPFRNEIYQRVFGEGGPLSLLKLTAEKARHPPPDLLEPTKEKASHPLPDISAYPVLNGPPAAARRRSLRGLGMTIGAGAIALLVWRLIASNPDDGREIDPTTVLHVAALSEPFAIMSPPGLVGERNGLDGGVTHITGSRDPCKAVNPSCAAAGNSTVEVAPGGQQDVSGAIDASSDEYFQVVFKDVPGPGYYYHPKIELTDSAHGVYTLQVENSCGSGIWCGKNISTLEMMFPSNTNGCLATGNCADQTPRSTRWIVRVARISEKSGGCARYTVRVSNI